MGDQTAHSQLGSSNIRVGNIRVGNIRSGSAVQRIVAAHGGMTPNRCRRAWGAMALLEQG